MHVHSLTLWRVVARWILLHEFQHDFDTLLWPIVREIGPMNSVSYWNTYLLQRPGSANIQWRKWSDGILQLPETAFKPYWCSSIWLEMKIRLLNVYILPVVLYGAESWSFTSVLEKKQWQWCLRRLSRISHLQCVTKSEVLTRTNQTHLSTVLCDRHVGLFGHVARSDVQKDHSRALLAVISGLPSHWRRPPSLPRQSWTRTIEKDLSALSIGLHTV